MFAIIERRWRPARVVAEGREGGREGGRERVHINLKRPLSAFQPLLDYSYYRLHPELIFVKTIVKAGCRKNLWDAERTILFNIDVDINFD